MYKNLLVLLVCLSSMVGKLYSQQTPKVKFGVISDVHPDLIIDGYERLASFLEKSKSENVDFIIQLGDFCFAKENNREFINLWHSFEKKQFSVVGNHDIEVSTCDEYVDFVKMPARYYSFDSGGVHFVVLDLNKDINGKNDCVDSEQLEWLRLDIAKTENRCVLFSHQNIDSGCGNRDEVLDVLKAENKKAGYTKIFAALNGHDHTSFETVVDGITFVQINSSSYAWVGDEGAKYIVPNRFTHEINRLKPMLRYMVPYKDAIFSIVTIDENYAKIKGVKSEFIGVKGDLNELAKNRGLPYVPYQKNIKIAL